jgi:sugar phosphate isomerase/epimerase
MSFIFTGIGDEAGSSLTAQIEATQALGWQHLEMRNVRLGEEKPVNFHDLDDEAFARACDLLAAADIRVSGFGSTIGNWAQSVHDDFSITQAQIDRAIPKMHHLGTTQIRIMSYQVCRRPDGSDDPDQQEKERFRRLREIKKRFDDAGITCVHENCMNYGGMSISHALRLLDAVPGLRWVYDTANPLFNEDRDHPGQRQDPWAFYQAVKPAISHIHIKDGIYNPAKKDLDYTPPGEGHAPILQILNNLQRTGYQGFISIEPHVAVVFHDPTAGQSHPPAAAQAHQLQSYIEYGRKLTALAQLAHTSA